MMNDPNDPCCKRPNCPANVTVVPNTGQSVSGFNPANPTITGQQTGTGGMNPGMPGATTSSMTGSRSTWIFTSLFHPTRSFF
jgi:hypothetical protein